jgi:hypothetical protein
MRKTKAPKPEAPIGGLEAITDNPARIVTEDDGEIAPSPAALSEAAERLRIIDATAIALYAGGWPAKNCYPKAALLWELRREWLEKQR